MTGFTNYCQTCKETVEFKEYSVPGFEHIEFAMHDVCGSIWYIAKDYQLGENIDLTPEHIEAIENQFGIEAKIVD